MLKLVYCVRRNPSLSREEFLRYWLDEHGPLVRSLRESVPSMVRYVQSHTFNGFGIYRIVAGVLLLLVWGRH